MACLQTIFNSEEFFGEISMETTKSILAKEPPKSYLFRQKNGTVTMATLFDFFRKDQLLEIEVKNCDCDGGFQKIQSNKNLQEFIDSCNFVLSPFKGIKRFSIPVKRNTKIVQNPLSLEDITKCFVLNHFSHSIDQLNLPKKIKETFNGHHKHFELVIDEKEASRRITIRNHIYDFFVFEDNCTLHELGIYQLQNLWQFKKPGN